jgi:hypothetical protein
MSFIVDIRIVFRYGLIVTRGTDVTFIVYLLGGMEIADPFAVVMVGHSSFVFF